MRLGIDRDMVRLRDAVHMEPLRKMHALRRKRGAEDVQGQHRRLRMQDLRRSRLKIDALRADLIVAGRGIQRRIQRKQDGCGPVGQAQHAAAFLQRRENIRHKPRLVRQDVFVVIGIDRVVHCRRAQPVEPERGGQRFVFRAVRAENPCRKAAENIVVRAQDDLIGKVLAAKDRLPGKLLLRQVGNAPDLIKGRDLFAPKCHVVYSFSVSARKRPSRWISKYTGLSGDRRPTPF